jgi:hypothetical protein
VGVQVGALVVLGVVGVQVQQEIKWKFYMIYLILDIFKHHEFQQIYFHLILRVQAEQIGSTTMV